jgi:hypothetical protein
MGRNRRERKNNSVEVHQVNRMENKSKQEVNPQNIGFVPPPSYEETFNPNQIPNQYPTQQIYTQQVTAQPTQIITGKIMK